MRLTIVAFLSSLGLACGATHVKNNERPTSTYVVIPETTATPVFALRGGAGPLNEVITAKIATGLSLLSGSTSWLAAKGSLEAYGTKSPITALQQYLMEAGGQVSKSE